MTDVSIAVMGLLMAVGLLLTALKAIPLVAARAFIYAGVGILCANAIGIKIVAPVSQAAADTLGILTLSLMTLMIVFFAGRGLVRFLQEDKAAAPN